MKSILGTSKREMFDKKITFTAQEAIEECQTKEEIETEMAECHPNEIYAWVTNPPDSVLPLDPSLVRIDTFFGINKYGLMSKRPPPQASNDPENRGVFLHVFT